MSEKNTDLNALTGGAEAKAADTTDWKAKYEEAQRQLDSAHVDQGRVKKLNEEKAELQKQLDEANAKLGEGIPAELRENFSDEALKGLAAMRKADRAAAAKAEAERRAELEALKEQIAKSNAAAAESAKRDLGSRVDAAYPGFLVSIGSGGDKEQAWKRYQRYNAASINAAVAACDFDVLSHHIGKFYRDELGLEPPSGGTGAAAPDPSATGGGTPAVAKPGKTYTFDEIDKLYDEIEVLRARGDYKGMKRLADEVENAQREGRVK